MKVCIVKRCLLTIVKYCATAATLLLASLTAVLCGWSLLSLFNMTSLSQALQKKAKEELHENVEERPKHISKLRKSLESDLGKSVHIIVASTFSILQCLLGQYLASFQPHELGSGMSLHLKVETVCISSLTNVSSLNIFSTN